MELPNMQFAASQDYRYGFNGKENDREWGTASLTQDYGFRLYNPAIAKFLSVDPLSPNYPWYTPYQFAGNKPILMIDLDGLEGTIKDGEAAARMPQLPKYTKQSVTWQPGHWAEGTDSGAIPILPPNNAKSALSAGKYEADFTLKISEKIYEYSSLLGMEAYMSRFRGKTLPAKFYKRINEYTALFANGKLKGDKTAPTKQTNLLVSIHLQAATVPFDGAFALIAQNPENPAEYIMNSTELSVDILTELEKAGIKINRGQMIGTFTSTDFPKLLANGKTTGPLALEQFKGQAGALIEIYSMADIDNLSDYKMSLMGFAVVKGTLMHMLKKDGLSASELEDISKELDKFKPVEK